MMNNVSAQIQRAINDALSRQVLTQIQNAPKAGSRSLTQKGWNISTERPDRHTEDHPNHKIRTISGIELTRDRLWDEYTDIAHDNVRVNKMFRNEECLCWLILQQHRNIFNK